MDKPKMRYCLKLDKEKYYYRIDPITAEKIIAKEIKKSGKAKENDKKNHKIAAGNAAPIQGAASPVEANPPMAHRKSGQNDAAEGLQWAGISVLS